MIGVLLVARVAAADCCGDCDGSGDVRVNELVTSVNNALGGCAAAPVAKVMKPRFVNETSSGRICRGAACNIVDYRGAGVLMWMAVTLSSISVDEKVLVTLDDDEPQEVAFVRDELRSESPTNRVNVRIPFGGLRFNERLSVQFPEGTFTPTAFTLYYLAE